MPYPTRLHLYRTAIPMRGFEHAAARRELAEAVVVRLDFDDARVGWGETLPRPYVTGETLDSVITDLSEIIWPACRGVASNGALLSVPDAADGSRCLNAALCAHDLAALRRLLDERGRVAPHVLEQVWGADLVRAKGLPRSTIDARVTGVLGSSDPARTSWRLRLMRWYGLKRFKLKLGLGEDVDRANLDAVGRQIGPALTSGRCSLRVDVNGGWTADETPERVAELARMGVCAVEQPVFCRAGELVELARRCPLPLIADESLLSEADAREMLTEAPRVWWNIRLSKNGGLVRSLMLARLAEGHRVPYILGCMVGESGILSAAQRLALLWGMQPREVEGNYGRFLLRDDLVTAPPRFGYGGRLRPLRGPGLGVEVDVSKIERYGTLVRTLT